MNEVIEDIKDSCMCCEQIECIDLFRRSENGENKLLGGEFYLYKQLNHSRIISENLGMNICSNGKLIESACFIMGTLVDILPSEYLVIIGSELVRDMRASIFNALSGHYRQAILLQRCVFENFLYGVYFYTECNIFSNDPDGKEKIGAQFLAWARGEFRLSDRYLIDIIRRGGVITEKEKKSWSTLFNNLSHFMHTILKTPTGEALKLKKRELKDCHDELNGCLSDLEFDKEKLIEWSNYYQQVFFIILNKFIVLFPEIVSEHAVKWALGNLKANFYNEDYQLDNSDFQNLLKLYELIDQKKYHFWKWKVMNTLINDNIIKKNIGEKIYIVPSDIYPQLFGKHKLCRIVEENVSFDVYQDSEDGYGINLKM